MVNFLKTLIVFSLVVVSACKEEEQTIPAAAPLEVEDTLFITIPGGSFVNSTGETVEIETFELQRSEVNNRLYRYLVDSSDLPHPADPGFPGMPSYFYEYPDFPVVNISAGKASVAASSIGARLPTRDEWEYAASIGLNGSIESQYPWGELSPAEVPGVPANYMALDTWEERDLDGFMYTAPCGSYPLSNAALADIAGNVAEMTSSLEDTSIYLMGGSWLDKEDSMKIGFRRRIGYGDISWYAGFRMAK